jgi:CRISPR/Cas system CSM-associated protein Csm2 small subunit
MATIVDTTKLIEIYVNCDDFLKDFLTHYHQSKIGSSATCNPTRKPSLSPSEIMSIVIYYHLSGYKCFQYYYQQIIFKRLKDYYPTLVSYHRFVALMPRVMPLLLLYLNYYRTGRATNIYYADSKKLPVCDNRRIHQNKVFSQQADRGKSSTGWFYGFKVFIIVNQYGELMKCAFTKASKADNNFDWMMSFFKGFKGKMFTDKGFLSSKAFENLYANGLKIITGIRANMKNKLVDLQEKLLHKKRGMIEAVNDILMTVCDIDHTRHRSPINFFVNLFAGLIAYTFFDKVPSIFAKKFAISNP